MYKIPENFNVNALQGEVIFQISYGLNFITLFFSKGFLQFEGKFVTIFKGHSQEYDEVYPVKNDFGLLQLLEQKIVDVNLSNGRNDLILLFENEFSLTLISNEAYESYTIRLNEEEIIV